MSVRARIMMTITGLAILIIAVGLGVGVTFTQTHLLKSIERDMFALADTADRLLSSEINLLKANVSLAAWYLVEAEANSGDFHKTLEEQTDIRQGVWALTVISGGDGKGTNIVDSAGSPPVHPEFINSPYVLRALAGEAVISTTRTDPASGKLVLHVCVPMSGNRVLIATIDGMYFSDVLKGLTIWETGHIFVDDAEGYVLANPREHWVQDRFNFITMAKDDSQYQSVAEVVSKMIRGETGMDTFFVGSVERFCFYRPISSSLTGWSLGVIAPVNESPLKDSRNGIWLVGIICAVLCIALAIPVSSYLEKPYRTISGIVKELEYQKNLLKTSNEIARILLHTSSARFEDDLYTCIGMMAKSVNASRLRIFQNTGAGEELRAVLKYEWTDAIPERHTPPDISFRYKTDTPNWYEKLSTGQGINSLTRDFSETEQALLQPHGVLALLSAPIFVRETFWGCANFDNCREERVFGPQEENILNSGVVMVTNAFERNEMETALIRAQEEAVTSAEAKSRFLANMSHEMRTPLNAIIGLTEMTLDAGGLEDENRENLDKIYDSGGVLLGLINDILDLSKIESGKFEIIPVVYDLPSLINDTVTLNSTRIGSKPLGFHLHIDENLPSALRGDDLRIKQLLNNLLSNAFKYTKQGRVDWTIKCKRDGGNVWFTSIIKDTGIGIRAEDLGNLFSDYNQVDTKANRKIEGTGLGLSITRKIAEMMDGSITVESEYGLGSTFTLRVRQGFVNDIPIGAEVAEKLRNFKYSVAKRNRGKIVRVPMPYAKVLVVDDVPINLNVARGLLKPYGMGVDCVSSGFDAITAIRDEKAHYDAVFMDHMMPEMDGVETVRIIREKIGSDYAKNVPIIALTADAVVGKREMFLSSGFQDFLSKPIDVRDMDAVLNRWVRDKQKETAFQNGVLSESAGARGTIFENWGIGDIDVEKGLVNFDGVIESYVEILESYVKDMPALLGKLRSYTREDIAGYRITAHSVKSSCRIIGAEALGARAESLETAAADSDDEYITGNSAVFIADVEKLIEKLSPFLSKLEAAHPKPLKSEPDPATLAALLEACKSFDISGINKAMDKLESFRYETGAERVSWLRDRIDVSDFNGIVELLEEWNS